MFSLFRRTCAKVAYMFKLIAPIALLTIAATPSPPSTGTCSEKPSSSSSSSFVPEKPVDAKPVIAALVEKFGKANEARITQGVTQCASLWRASDGDLKAFALE